MLILSKTSARLRVTSSGNRGPRQGTRLEFSPQAGHEQAGRRPALVSSPRNYNEKTSLALFCPITSRGLSFRGLASLFERHHGRRPRRPDQESAGAPRTVRRSGTAASGSRSSGEAGRSLAVRSLLIAFRPDRKKPLKRRGLQASSTRNLPRAADHAIPFREAKIFSRRRSPFENSGTRRSGLPRRASSSRRAA